MKYPVDPNRPICVNIGCESPVHLANRSSTGRPVYRPVCGVCHKAKLDLREGVTAVKKDYCENVDGRLGYKCTTTIVYRGQLEVDHIDGNPYNHSEENLQTLCNCCHTYKTHISGDRETPGRKTLKTIIGFKKSKKYQKKIKKTDNI